MAEQVTGLEPEWLQAWVEAGRRLQEALVEVDAARQALLVAERRLEDARKQVSQARGEIRSLSGMQ